MWIASPFVLLLLLLLLFLLLLLINLQRHSVGYLKEYYYSVCNRLARYRDPSIEDEKLTAFDAPHETQRKLQ